MPLSSVVGAQSIIKPGVCTSSTRPAVPFEGQMIYETDTDVLAIWNGSAWRQLAAAAATSGSVLQVVQGTTVTEVLNSTSTRADTGLTATITPKSTTSKVLVSVNQVGCMKNTGNTQNAIELFLMRGATDIQRVAQIGLYTDSNLQNRGTFSNTFLDSPATTSAITYKTQFSNFSNSASVGVQVGNVGQSTITLQEIAG
jgi:hypothetical protein